MAEAVVVGVRVRPFNDREIGLKATVCIDMQGTSTVIIGPSGTPQTFNFDQSFWSHDEFDTDDKGYSTPTAGGRYADQRYVFDSFGQRVLDNAWAGYHCCLFAYGQTGAGKSYSMVGYGENKGIVPISCEEIFNRIAANDDTQKRYEVCLSMIEIYNETVQDLFIPIDNRPKNGFAIRESKALGIYVDGIVKNAVDSYPSIERAIEQGTANRSVGSTAMNATSSRAHTVITIEFKQVEKVGPVENVKVSNVNLIDLAGSEKAGQTGATGDRLKEGSAINKSLSALGNVIEKLAEKSQNKTKKEVLIPYRDSKLTRLLQNALGGSSKTIMICALSPASSNYEETLSTLRYADRAKKIKNSAVVNENPQEKLMREMREENAKLKAMLEAGGSIGEGGSVEVSDEAKAEQEEKIGQLQQAMMDMQRSFQEKIVEARKRDEEHQTRQTLRAGNVGIGNPMIVNLNAEMQLTGKLRFEFPEGRVMMIGGTLGVRPGGGSSGSDASNSASESKSGSDDSESDDDEDSRPTIELSSPGVYAKHAKVDNVCRRCLLTCIGVAGRSTWINGVSIENILESRKNKEAGEEEDEDEVDLPEDAVLLRHCDRVVLGRAIFLFVDPQQGIAEMLIMSGIVSYAKARKELPASWKGTVKEGGGNQFQAMIRNAVLSRQEEVENEGGEGDGPVGQTPRPTNNKHMGGNFLALVQGATASHKGERSASVRASSMQLTQNLRSSFNAGDEDSDGASSLGDGATRDEVLISQLKDQIAAMDREILELRYERDTAYMELKARDQEIARLRQQNEEGNGNFDGAGPKLCMRGTMTSSRATFNEKVLALDRTFKEALAALDSTRHGLTKAVAAYDAAATAEHRSISLRT